MRTNKISVIITNYNDSRFLINAVKSAMIQYPDEIIFVDDYSTDNSVELVRRLSDDIKIIRNKGKKGVFNAVMQGFYSAKNDFVCPVSADDEFLPGHITKMMSAIDRFPFVDLFTCNCIVLREGEIYERVLLPFDSYISPEYTVKIMKAGLGKHINMTGTVIKKDVVIKCWEHGGHKMKCNFDGMHNFYCMMDKGFVNLGDLLYVFRSYPNSFGSSGKIKNIIDANKIQIDFMKKHLSKKAYDDLIKTGIYGVPSLMVTQVLLLGMKTLPKFIRKMFYDWCYGWNWKIEKL